MKQTPIVALLCLFAAVTLPVATSWGAGAEKPVVAAPAAAGVAWEYLEVSPPAPTFGPMGKEALDSLGARGWELVAVCVVPLGHEGLTRTSRYNYTFKRLKQG